MSVDFADKLSNVLCPLHHKKIQLMSMAEGAKNFFVCTTCLTKERNTVIRDLDLLVSIDDFKNRYINQMQEEMHVMKDVIQTNLNHMDSHIKNSVINIEEDFTKIENHLIGLIKSLIRKHKTSTIIKFKESNQKNKSALSGLDGQVKQMISTNEETLEELSSLLNTRIDDSNLIQKNIQEFLGQRRDFYSSLKRMKIISNSHSFTDLVSNYSIQPNDLKEIETKLKQKLEVVMHESLGSDHFRRVTISSPKRTIQEYEISTNEVSSKLNKLDF